VSQIGEHWLHRIDVLAVEPPAALLFDVQSDAVAGGGAGGQGRCQQGFLDLSADVPMRPQ